LALWISQYAGEFLNGGAGSQWQGISCTPMRTQPSQAAAGK